MSAHTPGPWSLELVEDRSIAHLCPVDQDGLSLLTVVHQDGTPFAAVYNDTDARLIAAAPELLKALQDILQYGTDCNYIKAGAAVQAARSAIAKATGSQT